MANSFVRYTGNGTTTTYAIPFSYRSAEDLSTTVAGVNVTAYTLDAAGTNLTFTTAPANNAAIEIRRTTSQNTKLVDYVSGSVLTENDLDTDSDQAFYMSQEAIDKAGDVISLDNVDFNWDIQNKRLKNVADPVDNTDAVNKQFISTNIPNITTVAGIASDVTTVANNNANITAVAADATDIGTVATNISSVNTVATNINDVIAVANDLAEAVSEVETVANDLNEATSEIDTVATNITNVNTVGTNIANVNTVAGVNANVTTVAGISADVTGVAGISTAVTNVNSNSTNINAVNANSANINTVAGISSDVTSVANISSDVAAVENIASNVTTVAGISSDVTSVAGISSNVTTVASNNANVSAVGGAITNVNNVGNSIASVNTVATNLASVNSFANTYLGASATAPTQDPDGSSLDLGDLYFDTASNTMKVYGSSGWTAAGSSVNGTASRFKYTATSGQTTFTGTDDNSATLAYDAGFLDVYLNGIRLVNGTDFTASTGNSIVLTTGANLNDILEIVAFGTFALANFSITDATDVPPLGSAGQALVVNSGGTALEFSNASSAEVYGFHKDSNGDLIVTTTNQGVDNISSATYATFDDVLFSASGFTFSLNNGELIATI
ncbi:tail fiber [Pelagibacter phage HTVC031P]|nr:tail fiber [Pelagibacter phage HTVC031P]